MLVIVASGKVNCWQLGRGGGRHRGARPLADIRGQHRMAESAWIAALVVLERLGTRPPRRQQEYARG